MIHFTGYRTEILTYAQQPIACKPLQTWAAWTITIQQALCIHIAAKWVTVMLVWQRMSKMKSRHWIRIVFSSVENVLPETILSVKELFSWLMSKLALVLWVEKPGVVWVVFSSPSLLVGDVNWVGSAPLESGKQLFPSTARLLPGRQEQWTNPSLFSQIWLQPPFMWRQTSASVEVMKTRIWFGSLVLIFTAIYSVCIYIIL